MGDGALTGAITGAIQGGMSGYANHLRYGSCFVAGTLVATATGYVAIEKIRAGDLVWAWDEETGDVALKPVVETYINETTELTHIFVGGEEIVATPTHPFYCPVKGWTDAAHLRAATFSSLSTVSMSSSKKSSTSCSKALSRSITSRSRTIIPIMYPTMVCWCIIRVIIIRDGGAKDGDTGKTQPKVLN